jgi:electron transport complex protein RnfG
VGKTIKLGLVLLLVCAISGGVLSAVYGVTSKIIDERKAKEQAQSMRAVLPAGTDFVALTPEEVAEYQADAKFKEIDAIYTGSADGEVKGLVARVAPTGYGGKITLLVGIGTDLNVAGVIVVSHTETAGLGSEVSREPWLAQFVGKGASGAFAVNKDGGEIQAVSSATISSRAVVRGVNAVRDLAATTGILGGASR